MKTVKEHAEEYIAKGWAVVPLEPNKKNPYDSNWKTQDFWPADFKDDCNIGIQHKNGIVIVDEDCAEVVALADYFLPETGAIYGRPSRPRSKRLYKSSFDKQIAYKDNGKTILEIRVNGQDMAPPSMHPDGEQLAWVTFGLPDDILRKILERANQQLATCAVIARNYNPKEQRHDWGLFLSGFLRRLGLSEEETRHIFLRAGTVAGDPLVKDRLTDVGSTYSKGEDEALAGAQRLKEVSSEEFVTSIRKIWGQEGSQVSSEFINEMNKRHAVVFQESGTLLVITESSKDGKEFLRYSTLDTIRNLYSETISVGMRTNGAEILKKKGEAWLDHKDRRQYAGIELNCKDTTPGYYNLWRGFTVEPKKGDWSGYKEHLFKVIASENKNDANWIFQWMASVVQEPTSHAHSAIALGGGQGVGKSTFVEWFGALFGQHFLEVSSYGQMIGRFNSHLQNAILVFGDEVEWGGNKTGKGNLNRMITQDTLSIERKGFDIVTMPNHLHIILASNEEWFLPTHFQERRYAAFEVSDIYQKKSKFFKKVYKQLFEKDGLSALLYDLLECKITVDLRDTPKTKKLGEQKLHSADFLNQWYLDSLISGDIIWIKQESAFIKSRKFDWGDAHIVDKQHLYGLYLEARKERGARAPALANNKFWSSLKKLMPIRKDYRDADRKYWAVVPKLEECREYYAKHMGIDIDWESEDVETDEQTSDLEFGGRF